MRLVGNRIALNVDYDDRVRDHNILDRILREKIWFDHPRNDQKITHAPLTTNVIAQAWITARKKNIQLYEF